MASGEAAYSVVRDAGLLERYHITLTQLGFDSCVVISAKYNGSGALLNRQTLYPALHQIILSHPALSVQLGYTSSKPKAKSQFIRLPSVPLDDIVSFAGERNFDNSIDPGLATTTTWR